MDVNTKEALDAATAQGLVLVDFWAPWCAPCRALLPKLPQVQAAHPDVTLVKVNADDAPALKELLGVMGLPTLILFRGGKEIARTTGNNINAIMTMIEKAKTP